MPTKTETGPNGEIELYYKNIESASTHRDQTKQAKLSVSDDKNLILVIEELDHDSFSQHCHHNGTAYSISVELLMRLIRQHGQVADFQAIRRKRTREAEERSKG